jgi:hypothetical protein
MIQVAACSVAKEIVLELTEFSLTQAIFFSVMSQIGLKSQIDKQGQKKLECQFYQKD